MGNSGRGGMNVKHYFMAAFGARAAVKKIGIKA
jgi:hypothetical protein